MVILSIGALPFGVNRTVSWRGDATRVNIPALTPFFSDMNLGMAADVESTAGTASWCL